MPDLDAAAVGALRLYRSNRVERLARALADELRQPLADPFAAETVVVHSAEMGRWLSLYLAHELGLAANINFDFPGKVVTRLFAQVAADGAADRPDRWCREALVWTLLGALPGALSEPAFAPLAGYLRREHHPDRVSAKELQLAARLAATFDRYVTFRPRMIWGWEGGAADADDWQQRLWSRLVQALGKEHTAGLARQLFAAVERGQLAPQRLPERLFLFGISTLPPLYLDIFGALARLVPVHLFMLCPSDSYWGDICSRRDRARQLRRQDWANLSAQDLHLDQGNPLLATFGSLGRDFQWVLEGRDAAVPYVEPQGALFVDPGQGSVLQVLQADMMNLVHRHPGADPDDPRQAAPAPLGPHDESVTVHACHGLLRQVEVLRDQLLAALSADPTLQPRDVVIMTPDLERAAPLIEAVFGDGDAGGRADTGDHGAGFPALPFRLADRSLRRESPVADALLRMLELASGRVTASEVLDLLALSPVRHKFGLDSADLPLIQGWVREVGVRWGMDAEHRVRAGQPGYAENTWRFGLDRLLLGRAFGADGDRVFAGALPWGELDGDQALLLGRLVDFCETLFGLLGELRSPATMAQWRDRLTTALDSMLGGERSTQWLFRQLRDVLDQQAQTAEACGVTRALSPRALYELLAECLAQAGRQGNFGTGAITVCAMVPLRSIPFRVVALLGMDDGAFPRDDAGAGFDRVAAAPRPGDRSARDDDRYLFLEALLSARQRLIVTYQGRGIRDNKELPPAVPLQDLLGVIEDSFFVAGSAQQTAAAVRAQLLTEHPLQAFSPRNFGAGQQGRSTSFDRRYLRCARRLLQPPQDPPPFWDGALPAARAAQDQPLELSLDRLVRFWQGPAAHFVNRQLGIWLRHEQGGVQDREPAELDGLQRYSVGDRLLGWALARQESRPGAAAEYQLVRAAGDLPLGSPGRYGFELIARDVDQLARAARLRMEDPQPRVELNLTLGQTRLTGLLDGLHGGGLVRVQYAQIKAHNVLGLWVQHLAALLGDPTFAGSSSQLGRVKDGDQHAVGLACFGRVARAQAEVWLQALVELYWRGQEQPLLFFCETSRAHAAARRARPGQPEQWIEAARRQWLGSGQLPGEGDDPHLVRLLGQAEPFAPGFAPPGVTLAPELGFATLAAAVWDPLLDALYEQVVG